MDMENKKYLYGAAVQGIQGFIFETNKLKEIVGASEMIEHICTNLFYEVVKTNKDDKKIILGAAGNIKYIFEDEQKCRDFVRIFPKSVMEYAPGINISQAVVKFEGEDYSDKIQDLENLLKAQRNKVPLSNEIGFMALERARRTGGVAKEFSKDEAIDEAASQKLKSANNIKLFEKMAGFEPKASELSFDIEEMTKSGKNSWIAIIHADGNGLGQIIQNHGKEMTQKGIFPQFSKAIDDATKAAVKKAFEEVVLSDSEKKAKAENPKYRYPIRPIVIGGDDLTVIIRADLAFEFTKVFLSQFELESEELFKNLDLSEYKQGLTACAGIAYIKESYPLHYGLHLAEQLCSDAKKRVKAVNKEGKMIDPKYNQMPKSALAIYKVQESFVEDLKILKERTLTTDTGLSYYACPYLLDEADNLSKKLNIIKEETDKNDKSKAVGKLRQIVSETYKDKSTAIFMMKRMAEVNSDFYKKMKLENELSAFENNTQSQLIDLITLHSFNYGNRTN
ncbi:MAG: hypothetical protein AUJ98_01645 [Bacteroidetes bacterium CG2_30_33_31]|nr:MAG: hypothetical protein AUJ98_01645 [Bacteroidetes bacterium CG2_30_33_31]